jgi:hypothetical protein
MLTLTDLLGRGYLPKQLPPPFFSTDWADSVQKHSISAPSKHVATELLRFSIPRPRGLPRIIGIPHPAHFHVLSEQISQNWATLKAICDNSTISLTTPVLGLAAKGQRALEARDGFPKFAQFALDRRAGKRVMLKADVSLCYPSIYTHAISWAIAGKAAAKAAAKAKPTVPHHADLIDKAVRDAQDKQSIGIPIGPDTSFLLANVLLSRVDEILRSKVKNLVGLRLLDDFELYFDTVAEAETVRMQLTHALASYNLTLNPGKTKVIDLPIAIEPDWKHEIAELELRGNARRANKRLRAAGDRVFMIRHQDAGSRAITYLLAMLSNCNFHPDIWPLAQSIALASMEFEENSLPKAAKLFITAYGKGWTIQTSRLRDVLNRIIIRNSLLRHGYLVAWAIWLMIVLKLKLSDRAVEMAVDTQDPIALPVLAHGREAGVAGGFRINALAKSIASPSCWNEPYWLFLNECLRHDWLGAKTKKFVESGIKVQPYLSILNKRSVSFYDVASGMISKSGSSVELKLAHLNAHAWAQIELPLDYE